MPIDQKDVCILIPTLNEEATIEDVVTSFTEQGFTNILVIDGGSHDATCENAREHGATVLTQTGSGKGQAFQESIQQITQPYILMIDGDGTYDPKDAADMLAPLADKYEHVIGNRYGDMTVDAMNPLNNIGNKVFNHLFYLLHREKFQDILSGYRAFTTESVKRCELSATGFEIETEFAVECVRKEIPTAVVPISYQSRPVNSSPKLRPVHDGWRIFQTLLGIDLALRD